MPLSRNAPRGAEVVVFRWPQNAELQALTARGSPMAPRHLGGGARLVDEHQPVRIEPGLALEPGLATDYDIGTALLIRVRRLFLSVILRRSKNRQSVPMPTPIPRSAGASRNSASVASAARSTRLRIKAALNLDAAGKAITAQRGLSRTSAPALAPATATGSRSKR